MSLLKKLFVYNSPNSEKKHSVVTIRVCVDTKDKWIKFCKDRRLNQQETFRAVLEEIMKGE